MQIKIIGSGCPTCTKLHQMVIKLKDEGKIKAEIKYSKDINELIELGVMESPALVVDGKVVKVGMVKDEKELLKLLK
jgi:small redox-active disulfide protein 2